MNTSTTTTAGSANRSDAASAPRTLDDLAALDVAALTALYKGGKATSLAALDGNPQCRMLAVRGLDAGAAAAAIRNLSAASFFPWGGKHFEPTSADAGIGINRVRLGGERRWFPFETRVEPSAIDGQPCILLDYGDKRNPFFIRAIRDELREVAPSLYLGPAMLDTGKGDAKLVLWFACDFSQVH
jgi:hypothetical protein